MTDLAGRPAANRRQLGPTSRLPLGWNRRSRIARRSWRRYLSQIPLRIGELARQPPPRSPARAVQGAR
eukprot:13121875-Alexandrium_andersonii.AAC.1